MTVTVLPTSIFIRAFEVIYVPKLDPSDEDAIRLGMIGELRKGKRYAMGLIARQTLSEQALQRVGRLARRLLERPFEFLRRQHNDIWDAEEPSVAFERTVLRTHSSLQYVPREPVVEKLKTPLFTSLEGDLERERDWCKEHLRMHLRNLFLPWVDAQPNSASGDAEPQEEGKAA